MSDIFISYARDDIEKAQQLAGALEGQGWSVFWDRTIPPGESWRSYIGNALEKAGCVIVTWSTESIDSGWVQEEADDAQRRGVLVPVLTESVTPPIGFRAIQAADLIGWDGDSTAESFLKLRDAVTARLGTPPAVAEEKQRHQAQAEARRQAEEEKERQRAEAEASRKAEEGKKRQRAEAERRAEKRDRKPHADAVEQPEASTTTSGKTQGTGIDEPSHLRRSGLPNWMAKNWANWTSVVGLAVALILVLRFWPDAVPEPRTPAVPKARIEEFVASSISITRGDTVTLTWRTTEADTAELVPRGAVATNGKELLSPVEDTEYTLIASGPGGEVRESIRIAVRPAAPQRAGDTLSDCADCPDMVEIPAGSFLLGSPETDLSRSSDEGPQRESGSQPLRSEKRR